MSNNKQSSVVDFIYNELFVVKRWMDLTPGDIEYIFKQAKVMHKGEVVKAWSNGYDEDDRATSSPLKYYNETYGGNNESNKQSRMTREEVISMGFEPIPHFTITDSLIYDLGRNRHLSIGDIGMPNEMVFICEVNDENKNRVDEIIVLHNYDYDGYLTKERLQQFMVLKHNNEQH